MKNCTVPAPSEQKRLLKVLSCYFNGYVSQTPSTDEYFANPTSAGYQSMYDELNAIAALVQNNIETLKPIVNCDDITNLVANIWTANAQGEVQYSSNLLGANTFPAANDNSLKINTNISNVGVLKQVQKLNTDDCDERAYQVTPVVVGVGDSATVFTQATLVERIGCSGVSNLGFIGFSLTLPVNEAPFNKCSVLKCV